MVSERQPFLGFALPLAREARRLTNEGLVKHGAMTEPVSLGEFGADFGAKNILDGDGNLATVEQELGFESLWELSNEELEELVVARLAPVYAMVNPSLNKGHTYGFNDHGLENHVRGVVLPRAREDLDKYFALNRVSTIEVFGKEIDQEAAHKVLTIMVLAHDLGNLLSRSLHPMLGFEILRRRLPEISPVRGEDGDTPEVKQEKAWHNTLVRAVRRGVQLHDEKLANRFIEDLHREVRGDDENFNELMRKRFGVMAIALLVADKSQATCMKRMPDKEQPNPKEALEKDGYLAVSVMAISDGGHTFVDDRVIRPLTFALIPPESHPKIPFVSQYCKNGGEGDPTYRVLVPPDMYKQHNEKKVPFSFLWWGENFRLNTARLDLETTGLFALYPGINTFVLKVSDVNPKSDTSKVTIRLSLDRDTYKRKLACLGEMFGQKLSVPDFFEEVVLSMRRNLMESGDLAEKYEFIDPICGLHIVVEGSQEEWEEHKKFLRRLFMSKLERKGV